MKLNQYKILFFLVVLCHGNANAAGFFEEKKQVNCSYKVGESPSVELNNQYGEIQIESWEKDSVKLEATITATSNRLEDIQKL